MAVDTGKLSCDYYDFMNNRVDAINAYSGEYMNEYEWAKFTVDVLYNQQE